ncbi:MAG: ATP phosphoribosyltransferase regulatory subunit [Gammaproteobacteria bacterium]|nr:ATP phosphoribosyltransferase regulatory subunit [Gammaproteobacteria bacterium]
MKTTWRLPHGVDELLPPAAWELEMLRRKVLDLFVSWGFEYVDPPVIEYLDALLVGSGEDLDLQTLKVVDQDSGQQLGVRADMTSQAVRIDAHSLVTDDVRRLCYAGNVVFAHPQIAHTSRVPFKAGAEIFGAASLAADAEIIQLMLQTVCVANIEHPVLLIGHMGIYRGLVDALIAAGDLDPQAQAALFSNVQRKSQADIRAQLPNSGLGEMMTDLPMLMGGVDRLEDIRKRLNNAPAGVIDALDQLEELTEIILSSVADVDIRLDVSELSGYGYHNGPVFAVYHPEHGSALAQGGRYDGIGAAFGRPRPATGFDTNLKILLETNASATPAVFAPYVAPSLLDQALALRSYVDELRLAGVNVKMALSPDELPPKGCTRTLVENQGQWQITDV